MVISKKCETCGEDFSTKRSEAKFCSVVCASKREVSAHTRHKISEGRKKFLSENPIKHPWRDKNKKISKPCEALKDYLRAKGINFVEEWQPLSDRFFSIDIAFPDIKFGIEVNGNQHYNSDGTLKPYYKERHDLIEKSGWILLELHYSSCYNDDILDALIESRKQPDYTEYFKIVSERKAKKITLPKGQSTKIANDEKYKETKKAVLASGIDFTSFGWVKKVAPIIGIKEQKVSQWMKRHLPEFYEKNCFKRKSRGCTSTVF